MLMQILTNLDWHKRYVSSSCDRIDERADAVTNVLTRRVRKESERDMTSMSVITLSDS